MNKHSWTATIEVTCDDAGLILDAFMEFGQLLDMSLADAGREYAIALIDSAGQTVMDFTEKYTDEETQ